jgi:hypothetical protein
VESDYLSAANNLVGVAEGSTAMLPKAPNQSTYRDVFVFFSLEFIIRQGFYTHAKKSKGRNPKTGAQRL